MGDPLDIDNDGQVSEEEEEEAFFLFIDDDDDEEGRGGPRKGGCLSMVLLITGITAEFISLPFLV